MYRIAPDYMGAPSKCIIRTADNAYIPFDPANTDYQAYLRWLEEGNEPLPPEGAERARNEDGTFKADDPATPDVNEAWVDGSTQ